MIEVKNLTKRYGEKLAVDNASFTVNAGEIVGFLGRNGAGKTTAMNMITGYISSTSGTALVDGYDILKEPAEVKKRIGYLPEQPPLYMDMTVNEYLSFAADIKKVPHKNRKEHLDRIKELVRITDVGPRIIGNLSKGYKQRVGLAEALTGNPPRFNSGRAYRRPGPHADYRDTPPYKGTGKRTHYNSFLPYSARSSRRLRAGYNYRPRSYCSAGQPGRSPAGPGRNS